MSEITNLNFNFWFILKTQSWRLIKIYIYFFTKSIAVGSGAVAPTGREKLALKKSNLKDFSVAYAKSGQSKCQVCKK